MGASENVKDILSFIYTEFEYKKHRIQESPSLKQTNKQKTQNLIHTPLRDFICVLIYINIQETQVCVCVHT